MLHGKTQLSLRINPQKVLRENLIESLNKKYRIISRKCLYSPLGLRVLEKESSHSNLFKIQEFINGEFVSQNEAYQLTLLKIKPQPNDRILDFRCKLGEKALTLASLFKGIEIVLFEEKGNFIDACRKNFELAQISYKLIDDIEILEKNEKKFDWVLLDVPCSETGLMRERPEVKLKFSLEALEGLEGLQRKLIEESLKFLKPNVGKFVYFTNSILEEVKFFLK